MGGTVHTTILITKNCLLFLGDVFRLTTALKRTSEDAHRKPLAIVEFVQLGRTHHHADNRSFSWCWQPEAIKIQFVVSLFKTANPVHPAN